MLTDREKQRINNIYYNFNNGGTFMSPSKVHKVLISQGWKKPGLYKIRKYIQSLDDYSLQKPVKRSFKRARVEVEGMQIQYDIDLADMSNISQHNDQHRFLLVVIDVFSRYLWMEPVKKKTANEVLEAMKKLVLRGMPLPKKFRSDKGSEFNNQYFKAWCRNNNIYYFTSQNETKANYAERVIKTLKTMLYRYFNKTRSYKYINILQKFVNGYNTTPHTSLNGIAPRNVNKSNETSLFAFMHLRKQKKKINVRKSNNKKIYKRNFNFKIGSMVRISHIKQPFNRAYQQQWSSEIFKISKRFLRQGIPMYKLKDLFGEEIVGNFYESEMQNVGERQNVFWYIEKKIKKRKISGEIYWFIKFQGFSKRYNQWIRETEIKET